MPQLVPLADKMPEAAATKQHMKYLKHPNCHSLCLFYMRELNRNEQYTELLMSIEQPFSIPITSTLLVAVLLGLN